jgi:thiamine-phosphate pyrophosphorylase
MTIAPQSPAIARILDANLNRAREGLRTIEEWCRFGLNSAELAEQCKAMRQEIARWHRPEFRQARDTTTDVGTQLTHPQEALRESLQQLLQANLGRVQEALRVLEEYGKLHDPAMGANFKQLRYQSYILEQKLFSQERLARLRSATLYLVTSPHDQLLSIVEAALAGGLSLVQYRDKETPDGQRWPLVQQLCDLCHRYGALFLVNDRLDLALAVKADGLHLGQQDLPIAVARSLLGPQAIIGRSTTNPDEMAKALAEGADYLGVGPVYATPTKVGKAATGLDYVAYARQHSPVPWFAIGGIEASNLPAVMQAGATQVAVVRAIMAADNPTQATQALLATLKTPVSIGE